MTDVVCEQELRAELADQGYVAEWARHHLDLIKAGEPAKRAFSFEVQTVRFGYSLAMVALAGEMNVEYALRFNAELGGACRDAWTLGYTNEIVGYVPVHRRGLRSHRQQPASPLSRPSRHGDGGAYH